MKIIDLIFSKISSEAMKTKRELKELPKVKADLKTKELEKVDIEGQKERKLLNLSFTFNVDYAPSLANVIIEGNLIIGASKDEAEEAVKEWKKSKTIDFKILNFLLNKCNVRALQLEDDLKLPYHISLPRIRPKVIEEKK